jgi:hypothetical protein
VTDFRFYPCDSPEYAADFQTLLRCYGEGPATDALLGQVLAPYGADAVAADWGAGSGYLTARLLSRCRAVYAVEPNLQLRAALAASCPAARAVDGTLTDTALPEAADVAFLRHVFYHIPDHKWGAYALRAAAGLSPRGTLVVTLKHPDTACNDMLEAFGARRFNLFVLGDAFRSHPEFRVEWVALPAPIVTTTFADTYAIARFMLADRGPDGFGRRFTEEEVRDYVGRHLWDERRGAGGWPCPALNCLIRRNEFWTPPPPAAALDGGRPPG